MLLLVTWSYKEYEPFASASLLSFFSPEKVQWNISHKESLYKDLKQI